MSPLRLEAAVPLLSSLLLSLALDAAPGAAEPRVAVRGEGYMGYVELDTSLREETGYHGGGAFSVSATLDALYLQADLTGDAAEFDEFDTTHLGTALHLGWREAERGSLGLVAAYTRPKLGDVELDGYRVGVEAELYLEPVTVGLLTGFQDIERVDDESGYLVGRVAYYPIERARLEARGGALSLEEGDEAIAVAGANAAFLAHDNVAFFARWEASFLESDAIDVDDHSIVFGVQLYYGAETPSLRAYDRAHFQEGCIGFRTGFGRGC